VGRIELRTFDGDLDALAAMAYETLFSEYGDTSWRDLNQPEVARLVLADVPDPRFLIGAYDGSQLVGFVANLPRRYRFNGQSYLGVYSTMLAARKGYQGVAALLMAECLRRHQEFEADLALFTLQKGTRAAHMFAKMLGHRYRIEHVRTMYALARVIDLPAMATSQHLPWYEQAGAKLVGADRPIAAPLLDDGLAKARCLVRPYRADDLDAILELTQRYSDRRQLVRVFSRAALSHRLHTEGITQTLVYERGGVVQGFINYAVYELLSASARQRWAWLDLLYWAGLAPREKQALLAALWQQSRERGCIGILDWSKGSYAVGPLLRARFVPYPLGIEMMAWVLNPALSFRGVRGVWEEIA